MHVLAIDTATPLITATMALVLGPSELIERAGAGEAVEPVSVLGTAVSDDQFAHAESLMPLVQEAVQAAGLALPDLSAVVVGVGPGPYTGLRVGIATAAALGDALGIAVHPAPSHDALFRSITPQPPATVVITDARRREVYVSAFDGTGRRIGGPAVMAPAELPTWLAALDVPVEAMTGPGCGLAELDLPELPFGDLGAGAIRAAAGALVTGAVPGPLAPLYLRRPDATEPNASKSVLR